MLTGATKINPFKKYRVNRFIFYFSFLRRAIILIPVDFIEALPIGQEQACIPALFSGK
jgi:hypothetical protein